MRSFQILSLAAVSFALVLPSEEALGGIQVEDHHHKSWVEDVDDVVSDSKDSLTEFIDVVTDSTKGAWREVVESTNNALDEGFKAGSEAASTVSDKFQETAFDVESWLDTATEDVYGALGGGHHGHHPPNQTVYQLIAESKYTTRLSELINKYPDLVETLNSTHANYTVFAPTDKAFEKIPKHPDHEPSKELIESILKYHVSPDFYPAQRVLVTHTVPTLLESDSLGSEPRPQRLAFKINLKGLTVNFYSRIVAVNIYGTNGVIHGVDSLIIPPPKTIQAIDLFPGAFSTLELGLAKTGLLDELNTTAHHGGTFFTPSNFAFQKLGPKINAFLFSQYGQKYLRALLTYHVVPDNTLYSDAYYKASSKAEGVPKGYFHTDLPTLLKDRALSVDVARYGGLIDIKINGFSRVTVQDGITKDGVIQVVGDVLIPPKNLAGQEEVQYWTGEELSVDDLVERLEPFIPKSDL